MVFGVAERRSCVPFALALWVDDEREEAVCRLRKGEGRKREAREGELGLGLLGKETLLFVLALTKMS